MKRHRMKVSELNILMVFKSASTLKKNPKPNQQKGQDMKVEDKPFQNLCPHQKCKIAWLQRLNLRHRIS